MGRNLRNAREQLYVDGAEGEWAVCRSELDDGGLASHNLHREALHALEEQAEEAMNMTCTDVQAGGTIVPAGNTCFRLVFQEILAGGLRGHERFLRVSLFSFLFGRVSWN